MSNPTQTPPPAPAKVHKLEDEETPRRSDMDITGLKDFDSISQIFPQKQGVWLWGSIQAGLIHATEEMENPENVSELCVILNCYIILTLVDTLGSSENS
jgi:hypothetical protein